MKSPDLTGPFQDIPAAASAPEVSVVMGVYNGAPHLRETIDSILVQEDVALEFVIVNDGSTDESPQLLDMYARQDARVRIIHQENQGLTKALIKGCLAARGQYIARQDVGDMSAPKRLYLQQAALAEDAELAFVSSWTEFYGPEWEFLYTVKGSGRATSPTYIISEAERYGVVDGPTCHPSVMFRKESYLKAGGYRSQFYYGQDWDLWYRLAECGKFQTVEQALYKVRIMPGGLSLGHKVIQATIASLSLAALHQRRRSLSELQILDQANALRPGRQRKSKARSEALGFYFIGECLRQNGDNRSLDYFKESIKASPVFLKSWVRLFQNKLNLRLSRAKI